MLELTAQWLLRPVADIVRFPIKYALQRPLFVRGQMRIELNCAKCGDNSFKILEGMGDDAVIRCADCNHIIGTMAELKERVANEVMKRVEASR